MLTLAPRSSSRDGLEPCRAGGVRRTGAWRESGRTSRPPWRAGCQPEEAVDAGGPALGCVPIRRRALRQGSRTAPIREKNDRLNGASVAGSSRPRWCGSPRHCYYTIDCRTFIMTSDARHRQSPGQPARGLFRPWQCRVEAALRSSGTLDPRSGDDGSGDIPASLTDATLGQSNLSKGSGGDAISS